MTPAVKLSVPGGAEQAPVHIRRSRACASSEKIFTPTNSASSASVTKNPASARNRRVARWSARCPIAKPGRLAHRCLLHRAEAVGQRPLRKRPGAGSARSSSCSGASGASWSAADRTAGPSTCPRGAHARTRSCRASCLGPGQVRLDALARRSRSGSFAQRAADFTASS